jgi:hypothetical protein
LQIEPFININQIRFSVLTNLPLYLPMNKTNAQLPGRISSERDYLLCILLLSSKNIHLSQLPACWFSAGHVFLCSYRRTLLASVFNIAVQSARLNQLKVPLAPHLWTFLNNLENLCNFRYRYFQFHGAFSFQLRFLGKNPSKGKAPFFLPFWLLKIYTKDYTLPIINA